MWIKFEVWIVKRFIKRVVKQGYHAEKIKMLYCIINKSAYNEFTEDTKITVNELLKECFDESIKQTTIGK